MALEALHSEGMWLQPEALPLLQQHAAAGQGALSVSAAAAQVPQTDAAQTSALLEAALHVRF